MIHDHQVFGGWDDAHRYAEISAEIVASPRTLLRCRSSTMPSAAKAGADFGARGNIVFADAAGEDQHVEPAQFGVIAANPFGDGPRKLVDSEARFFIAILDGFAQIAHVVGEPADAEQAGLLADHGLQLVGCCAQCQASSRQSSSR